MALRNSSWKCCSDTGGSTVAQIIFYQGGTIDHETHLPGTIAHLGAKSEYNVACTSGMDLAHVSMLIRELLKKDPDMVPKEGPLIILKRKYAVCMDNNGKDTKHKIHIYTRVSFVRNDEN